METLLEWANILHDEITGVVWYYGKKSRIFTFQIFFTRVMKMESFHNFIIWGKCEFHNLNLKIMKINKKKTVNFLIS